MVSAALLHLPPAVFALAPELAASALPDEVLATCDRCAVGGPAGAPTPERPFNQDLKCCTWWPEHANWLVGRTLMRDGEGAARVRAQLGVDGAATVHGLKRPPGWLARYLTEAETGFGVDASLLCPYYARDMGRCTVWEDRASVCRTWHCKSVEGRRGRAAWVEARGLLHQVERALAIWCTTSPDTPSDADLRDPAVAEDWYRRCATRVAALDAAEAQSLRNDAIRRAARKFTRATDELAAPLPTFLGPQVGLILDEPDDPGRVLLGADTHLQLLSLPRTIFQLLSRLDGRTPWPEALAAAEAAVGPFPPGIVPTLFRHGLLEARDPAEPDPPPGMSLHFRPEPRDEE